MLSLFPQINALLLQLLWYIHRLKQQSRQNSRNAAQTTKIARAGKKIEPRMLRRGGIYCWACLIVQVSQLLRQPSVLCTYKYAHT